MEIECVPFVCKSFLFICPNSPAEVQTPGYDLHLTSVILRKAEEIYRTIPIIKASGIYTTINLSIVKTSTTETCETGAFIEESGVEISENLTFRKTSAAEAYRNVTFSETAAVKRCLIVPVFQQSTAEMNTTDEVLKPSGIYSFKTSDYDKNKESFTK
jgi:hypothetical protein